MSTPTTTPPSLDPPATARVVRVEQRRRRRPHSRDRVAYAMIAPAVAFMVLVHLLPTAGGVFLSFENLNTFTFSQLFGAPWAGLDNYRAILFDAGNPLRSGFLGAVQN